MSLSWLRRVVGVAVVLGALVELTPLWAQTGGVSGVARDEKGNLLVGYPIIIERQEVRGIYKTKTNKKGQYIYIGLPIGGYKVTLQDPNGRPLFYFETRIPFGDTATVDFDLAVEKAREAKAQERAIEENPELKRQMEERQRSEREFTSLKDLVEHGNVLYDGGRFAEAAAAFEKALPLAKDKNTPIVLARLGESYHKGRQFDQSVNYWQKAIEANPAEGAYHNGLGNVYADMGKFPEAAAEFKKAADIDPPQASRYYYNYGVVMYNSGRMDEAAEAFKKATEFDPNYADAFFMQGRALMANLQMDPETGEVKAAPGTAEALEAYLKLEPNGTFANEAQAMLQTIKAGVKTGYTREKKKKKS